uniref:LRFN-1 n=1 Tax=Dendrocoelum lacteum TaxID=27895 RepID=T1DF80_9PLAT
MRGLFWFLILNLSFFSHITFCYKYFSSKNCEGFEENGYYDINCRDCETFPEDLPLSTEKLTLSCPSNVNDSTVGLTALNSRDFEQLESLNSIIIKSCPIETISEKLFSKKEYLGSVTLENLPLRHLRNIFFKSSNLIELSLINLYNLEYIDSHILENQNKFSRLKLKNVTISTDVLQTVLSPIKNTIRELSWTDVNHQILVIQPMLFSSYKLGLLDLSNNKIENWNFLIYTKSRKILLKNTVSYTSNFLLSKYASLPQFTQVLDLENIGIFGQFPSNISKPMIFLKTLNVKSNLIDSLNDNIDQMFPNLLFFDISLNRIKHLQSKLNNFFYKTEYFKLEGNPLHCNCEIRWLFARYKSKIQDFPRCHFGFKKSESINNRNSLKDIYFSQLSTDSLACFPPLPPVLSISKGKKSTMFTVNSTDPQTNSSTISKQYTLVMDPHQRIDLSCETLGDPIPTLTWSNKKGKVLHRSVLNITTFNSAVNTVTVGLSASEKSLVYMCTASNIEGVSFALVNIISTKIQEPQNAGLVLESNEKVLTKSNSKNIAHSLKYCMHIKYYLIFFVIINFRN